MCAIAVLVHLQGGGLPLSEIKAMTRLAAHRGPDGEGFCVHNHLALGHRRLSIVDRKEHSAQPFRRDDCFIVFNGEIFNYAELRADLMRMGYRFQTQSDTEVLLTAWQAWGAECQQRLNGMWAFAIFDLRHNSLFLSRDRYGIKPLYYTEAAGKFCVASEIKQFQAVAGWQARLNPVRVFEFLNYGYFDHTAETMWKDVYQLPPGHSMTLDLSTGRRTLKAYYNLSRSVPTLASATAGEYAEAFRTLWMDAVTLRLCAEVPAGTALSGGLDSASIAFTALHTDVPSDRCVSVFFREEGYNENVNIQKTLQAGPFRPFGIWPDFRDMATALENTLWHMDEPFGSMTMIAGHLLFKEAAQQGIRVLLTGQGADEILAGYEKFYRPLVLSLYSRHQFAHIIRQLWGFWKHHPYTRTRWWQKTKAASSPPVLPWIHPAFVPPAEALFRRQAEDSLRACSLNLIQEVGLPMLLHYEDRNSMAHGVEARLPFLDHRLVEFCLALPDDVKIKNGIRKYLLRMALKDMLPAEVRERYEKVSFICPETLWMRQYPDFFGKQLKKAVETFPFIFDKNLILAYGRYVAGQEKADAPLWRSFIVSKWLEKCDFSVLP